MSEEHIMAAPFLDRRSTVAPPGYDRFLVPPAAFVVQLSIGQVYAFSSFNLPLTRIIGISHSAPGDWTPSEVGWIFSLAIASLGLSAALCGRWVEQMGPRRSMFTAALCFGGGFIVSAVGVHLHWLWLIYLGYGVLGGGGLGIGYLSPVSSLMQWFPDRPGLATGMAIMGFGGGALIAAPLTVELMEHFRTATSNGVLETFVTLGVIYFMYMMIGVSAIRIPALDGKPAAAAAPANRGPAMAQARAAVEGARHTPQFWLLWGVLCTNAAAGIGVLDQASPMIREAFDGRITPAATAGFLGLLALGTMLGMFAWSAMSDTIGRRNTYTLCLGLGIVLCAVLPTLGHLRWIGLFVAAFAIVMSTCGGGFATLPAYVQDRFGRMHVDAIHGQLLTAWSVAGIVGPVLAKYLHEYLIGIGVPRGLAHSAGLYAVSALLVVGLACNLRIRPAGEGIASAVPRPRSPVQVNERLIVIWLAVGLPLLWGVSKTLQNALKLFQ